MKPLAEMGYRHTLYGGTNWEQMDLPAVKGPRLTAAFS